MQDRTFNSGKTDTLALSLDAYADRDGSVERIGLGHTGREMIAALGRFAQ